MHRRLGLLLALTLASAGCASSTTSPPPGPGDEPPGWSFTSIDGSTHSSTTSAGEPVLLFFMSTWCTKCQATAPRLQTMHHEYEGEGLRMFTLSHDPSEDAKDVEAWQQKYQSSWPHGVDEGSEVAKVFSVTRQSTVIVLDDAGFEVQRFTYATPSESQLRAAIDAAFAR